MECHNRLERCSDSASESEWIHPIKKGPVTIWGGGIQTNPRALRSGFLSFTTSRKKLTLNDTPCIGSDMFFKKIHAADELELIHSFNFRKLRK